MKRKLSFLAAMFLTACFLMGCARDASVSLAGEWKLVSYGDPANPMSAVPDVETLIYFDPEGRLSGNVGCNGFSGEYKVDGNQITFDSVASTLMACEGPIGQQEHTVLSVFAATATFELNGNLLRITSADGSSLVLLERSE
ncbi:MAG TPA: META domain-containing protein [Anaerolineales bacterium]|nr:META domain-containing protein [Anaerolineales bacterium]